MKAFKTDYEGVTFRSQLEAKYARYLDLNGDKWEYEPDDFWSDYQPDFKVEDRTGSVVIREIKPAEVSDSYLSSLADAFERISKLPKVQSLQVVMPVLFELIIFSKPDDSFKLRWSPSGETWEPPRKWLEKSVLDKVLEYRFDLKSSGGIEACPQSLTGHQRRKAVQLIDLPNALSRTLQLIAFMQGKNEHCWPMIPTLASELRCSEGTVYRHLKELKDRGHLVWIKVDKGERGTNRFRVILPDVSADKASCSQCGASFDEAVAVKWCSVCGTLEDGTGNARIPEMLNRKLK